MSLSYLTIKEAAAKLKSGDITSVELTRACLDQIRATDGKVHACLTVCEEEALLAAEEADIRRKKGEDGELLGIPFLVKDNILTKGVKTTAASKILENYTAPYDATIVKRLKEAGAVMLGKTNLDEFAHGASTENSAFGVTHNPWNLDYVPGGSSGGSAAAVAAGMCLFALGTDTGGSIRHPASYCGVVGLKPTYGRASRFGLIAMTSSTDVPGPFTRSVEDQAIVMSVIAGVDRHDATTVDNVVPDYSEEMKNALKGMRIGLPKEFFIEGLHPEVEKKVKEAIQEFEKLGAELVEIDLPHTKYAVATYYIITPSEISSNLGRFDGIKYGFTEQDGAHLLDIYKQTRGRGFGPEAKRRIMLGTFALSAGYFDAYYLQAQKVRTVISNELDRELENVDVILTPTTPHPAFKIGQKGDPLAMYLEDIFMSSASLAGLPAISVPCGFVEGLPVGIQLIGRRFAEADIFRAGHAYQQTTEWHKERPTI